MKVVLLQMDIVWADPAANRSRAESLMDSNPGADLYILPEMFSTGFATRPDGIAEEFPCESLEWMKTQASKRNAAVAGSVAVHRDHSYYNRFFFVRPDGEFTAYDKKHLFTFGGEHFTFSAGSKRRVVEFRGMKFLLAVCYDLRFPVWMRCVQGEYDAIICVASWPEKRQIAWDTLSRARAIENLSYMLCVNRAGDDPALHYAGGSAVIGPQGEYLTEPSAGQCCLQAEISKDYINEFRAGFPAVRDADAFQLLQ